MIRDWFKCVSCGIECDNSVRYVSETGRLYDVCQVCMDSFCPCCDSLYAQPTPTARQGWTAQCPECGHRDFFASEVARNIVELNHRMKKETHQ